MGYALAHNQKGRPLPAWSAILINFMTNNIFQQMYGITYNFALYFIVGDLNNVASLEVPDYRGGSAPIYAQFAQIWKLVKIAINM